MATFTQIIKELFYNNNNNAGTTTSRIPLLDASGNPIGSNTLDKIANLSTPIVSYDTSISTLNVEVGKYYRLDAAVGTLSITLPSVTDTTSAKTIVVYLTTTSTPSVTISSLNSADIYYQDGYAISASNTYEINILWNGAAWIVASVKINTQEE